MSDRRSNNGTGNTEQSEKQMIAEKVREACLKAAREGFLDASISGLCSEGAMEAAVGAIQSLDLNSIIEKSDSNS